MTKSDRELSVASFIKPVAYATNRGNERPQRIHIIGTAGGTGKTTLAKRLGVELGISVYDLDAIAYEGAREGRPGVKRPLKDRMRDISGITRQPAWVTEGCYLWWVDELLSRAQLIIWLDLHWSVFTWRVVKREVRRWLAREQMHGGILDYIDFLRGGRTDYLSATPRTPKAPNDDSAISRAGTLAELSQYQGKTVRCAKPREVETVLNVLTREEHRQQ